MNFLRKTRKRAKNSQYLLYISKKHFLVGCFCGLSEIFPGIESPAEKGARCLNILYAQMKIIPKYTKFT